MMQSRLGLLLLILVGLVAPVGALSPALPATVAEDDWRPLSGAFDRRLQARLERAVSKRPGWGRLIKRKKFGIALVDISDPARPRFAAINGNTMLYAASLPKIAILLAAVDAVEGGRLPLDGQLDRDLHAMIRTSSNAAATRVSDRLGGLKSVNEVLTDPRFKFYDRQRGGGLWVGKRYAKGGRRLPDPLNGISHGATATQVARFYYRLATGRLISHQASQRMLGYMVDPGVNHKFVNALGKKAPDAVMYRKSGTWRQWHADSVLVWGPEWRRYILVGMVEDDEGEAILQTLVSVAERALREGIEQDDRDKR